MGRFNPGKLILPILGMLNYPVYAAIDPAADIIELRLDCGASDDCFDSVLALNEWIATIRLPDATAPLLVEIGPGTYSGPFKCSDVSHITLRGSGRSNTVLHGDKSFLPNNILFAPAMVLDSCHHLNVEAMAINGEYGAIWWDGDGETTWTGVDVQGTGRAWYERMECDPAVTRHSWFNSRLVSTPYATSNVTYSSFCGETWLYNTTLLALSDQIGANGYSWGDSRALWIQGGEAHVIGGSLRNRATIAPAGSNAALEAVRATTGDAIINGALISVETVVPHPLYALVTETEGLVQVSSSYYQLDSGGALVTRIDERGGKVDALHDWDSGTEPPDIVSITGADRFLETDCDSGGCQVTGNELHQLVYDAACTTAGPWYDMAVSRCRGL